MLLPICGLILAWAIIAPPPGAVSDSEHPQGTPTGSLRTVQDLESLSWSDLASAVRRLDEEPEWKRWMLDGERPFSNGPTLYLRALLLMAENQPEAALRAFQRLEVANIPPLQLYVPYRLQESVSPGQSNAFRGPLLSAMREGRLPALIEARMAAGEGEVELALAAYGRSNPSHWVSLDLDFLVSIRRHAGFRPDAERLLGGAFTAGLLAPRVVEDIRSRLKSDEQGEARRVEGLGRLIGSRESLRALATAATARQLEDRQRFARGEFHLLLEGHRSSDPRKATNETTLMMVLAAARLEDHVAWERWSLELRRRFPDSEVREWILSLRPSRAT